MHQQERLGFSVVKPQFLDQHTRATIHQFLVAELHIHHLVAFHTTQLYHYGSGNHIQNHTMDPERRVLRRVVFDEEYSSEIDLTFNTLMGDKVEPRRDFIEERAKYANNLDI